MDFSGARVEDLEEYALAFAHLDGSVVAQHAAVDGTGDVVDHEGAVVAGGIVGLPIVQDYELLLIVVVWIGAGRDVKHSELAGVEAVLEVAIGHGVGVVPVKAGGPGGERDAGAGAGRDHGRALFHGAVHVNGDPLAVPVDDFRAIELG